MSTFINNLVSQLKSKFDAPKQDAINFFSSIPGSVQNSSRDVSDDLQKAYNTVTQRMANYFNPESNGGTNFWSTPVANTLGQIQNNFVKPVENFGDWMQKFPTFDTTKLTSQMPKYSPIGFNMGVAPINLTNFAVNLPGDIVRNTGDFLSTSANPEKLHDVFQGVKDYPQQFKSGDIRGAFSNPATSYALSAPLFFGGSVKKQVGEELIEQGAKTKARGLLAKITSKIEWSDPLEVQNLKTSLAEGEGYLATNKDTLGRTLTPDKREMIERSIINTKSKIADFISQGKQVVEDLKPEVTGTIDKLIGAIRSAEGGRGIQEVGYTEARGAKLAKMMGIRNTTTGEQGFYQELGGLKGALPKVNFPEIRSTFDQTEIDDLFNAVKDSPKLDEWQKVNARAGLAKLFQAEGGTVPTEGEIKLLNQVFPEELTKTLLDKRPTTQKFLSILNNLVNLPKALLASLDLSAPFRQGVVLVSHPKEFFGAFPTMFKSFGSDKALEALSVDIKARPTYGMMKDFKLALTELDGSLTNAEEQFLSNWANKIPGIRASNRAYVGFLNKLRADTFDSIYNKADDAVKNSPTFIKSLASFINNATGRGELPNALESSAPVLNGILFSPRLVASRLNLLNPAYYVNLDPTVRKEAIKSILGFLGTGLTVLGLSKLAGADVVTDPRNADFLKVKIGNTRYDIWGGFQQYFVALARLATGQYVSSTTGKEINLGEGYKPMTRLDIATRLFEYKESPIASLVFDLLRGQTAGGQPLDLNNTIVQRFVPMLIQDLVEGFKTYGFGTIAVNAPSVFGIGTQTYGYQLSPEDEQRIKFMSPEQQKAFTDFKLAEAQQKADEFNAQKEDNGGFLSNLFGPKVPDTNAVNAYFKIQDVVDMPENSIYELAQKKEKVFSVVDKILDDKVATVEQKTEALSNLGVTMNEAVIYNTANQSETVREALVLQLLQNSTNPMQTLAGLRMSVNNKVILSSGIISDLKSNGLISANQAEFLKNLNIDSKGNMSVKRSGSGSSRKMPTPNYSKLRIPVRKPTYTMPSISRIPVRAPRTYSMPQPKLNYQVPKLKPSIQQPSYAGFSLAGLRVR